MGFIWIYRDIMDNTYNIIYIYIHMEDRILIISYTWPPVMFIHI